MTARRNTAILITVALVPAGLILGLLSSPSLTRGEGNRERPDPSSMLAFAPDPQVSYINMFIRHDEERSCGLQRLAPTERERLNEVFRAIAERLQDNLTNSALAYLRNRDWSEMEITGTRDTMIDSIQGIRRYVTAAGPASRSSETGSPKSRLLLEPKLRSTLMPGDYLGRIDSTQCEVISPQGDIVEFWIHRI